MTHCPTCGRRTGKGWRKRFTPAEEAEIARLHLRGRVKQKVIARERGCTQGMISRIVSRYVSQGERA